MSTMRQRSPFLVRMALVALIVLVAVAPSASGTPSEGSEESISDDVLEEAAGALEPAARDLWPATFAGVY